MGCFIPRWMRHPAAPLIFPITFRPAARVQATDVSACSPLSQSFSRCTASWSLPTSAFLEL